MVECKDGVAGVDGLEDQSVHLILSDIPYGISSASWDVLHENTNSALLGSSPAQKAAGTVFRSRGKPLNGWSAADRKIPQEYQAWCDRFASGWFRVLKPGGSAFVFAGRRLAHRCLVSMEDAGFVVKDVLAWIKPTAPHRAQRVSRVFDRRNDGVSAAKWVGWRLGNLRPLYEPILWLVKPYKVGATLTDNVAQHEVGAYDGRVQSDNVFRAGFALGEDRKHVAQKPIQLLRSLIQLTTLEGQLVVDPFCGSGSTLVAAQELNRAYIGFDVDEKSVRVARTRLGGVQP